MHVLSTFIFLIVLNVGFSQSQIIEDSLRIHRIISSPVQGVHKKVKHEKVKYNYCEIDSLGNYTVLGNLDAFGVPKGQWKFFLGDVTGNGKIDWCMGRAKKGKLEGKWLYSWLCIRHFKNGIEQNPQPCPTI